MVGTKATRSPFSRADSDVSCISGIESIILTQHLSGTEETAEPFI